MGIFGRRAAGRKLPADIVARMALFGRYEFDPSTADLRGYDVWSDLQSPLLEYAQADPAGFAQDLAAAVLPVGGWPLYGASRTIWNLLGNDFEHPKFHEVRAASLEFFRANGVPPKQVTGGDWDFWMRTRGRHEPWLKGTAPPPARSANLTPLRGGELRRIAQVTAAHDSNIVFACLDATSGRCKAVVEARRSDEDPTRTQFDWLSQDTQYELYISVGEAFQVPTYWVAEELAPFIPLPRPRI